MKRFWLILATFLGLAATSVPASANLAYTLNQGGSLAPTPGNYGTVSLYQVGSGSSAYVTVKVEMAAGNVFLSTGSHSGFTFNLLGSINPSSITITSPNASLFAVQPYASPGSFSNSPFGPFEYAIKNVDTHGYAGIPDPLIFDIKASGGLILTDTLFSPTAGGQYFAADIGLDCTENKGKYDCSGTGVVASNGPPTQIPEPQTWLLFFAGLAGMTGLVLLQRRRKLARA